MATTDDELQEVTRLIASTDAESAASRALPPHGETLDGEASLYEPLALGDELWVLDDLFEAPYQLPTSSSESGEAPAPPRAPTSSERVKTCRQRQKAELEYLKQRVVELEQELDELKSAAPPSTQVVGENAVEANPVAQFWQRQASSERRARQQAVAENARLRLAVENQIRLAKTLARVLRKRPVDADMVDEPGSWKRNRLHDARDAEIFELLMSDFDVRYAEVDKVFAECGLAGNRTTYETARFVDAQQSSSPHGWYLEFVSSRLAPFEYAMTRDVCWRAWQTPRIPLYNGAYESVEVLDDVVKGHFTVPLRVGNTEIRGHARFVVRRYIEESRCVLIWALWSTAQGGLLNSQQVLMLEEGWSVLSPVETSDDATLLTAMQGCGRMRPNMAIKPSSRLETTVGLLTDVILGTYFDTLRGLEDHIGRMLMEEAARSAGAFGIGST